MQPAILTAPRCPDFVKDGPCSAKERNGPIEDWATGYCKPLDPKDKDEFPCVLAEKWDEGLFFMGQLKGIKRDSSGKAILQFQSEDGATELPYPEFNINELAPSTDERSYLYNYGAYAFEGGTGPEAYLSDQNKTLNMTKPIRALSKFQVGQRYWVAQQGYYFHSYYLGKEVPETKDRVKAIHWLDCMNPEKNRRYKKKFLKAIPGYMYKIEALDNKSLLCLLQINIDQTTNYTEYMKHDTKKAPYKDRVDSIFEERLYNHKSDVYMFLDMDTSKHYLVARGGITEFVEAWRGRLPTKDAKGKVLHDNKGEAIYGAPSADTAKIRRLCYYALETIVNSPNVMINLVEGTEMAYSEFLEQNIKKMDDLQVLNKLELLDKGINVFAGSSIKDDETVKSEFDVLINEITTENAKLSPEEITEKIIKLKEEKDMLSENISASAIEFAKNHLNNPNANPDVKAQAELMNNPETVRELENIINTSMNTLEEKAEDEILSGENNQKGGAMGDSALWLFGLKNPEAGVLTITNSTGTSKNIKSVNNLENNNINVRKIKQQIADGNSSLFDMDDEEIDKMIIRIYKRVVAAELEKDKYQHKEWIKNMYNPTDGTFRWTGPVATTAGKYGVTSLVAAGGGQLVVLAAPTVASVATAAGVPAVASMVTGFAATVSAAGSAVAFTASLGSAVLVGLPVLLAAATIYAVVAASKAAAVKSHMLDKQNAIAESVIRIFKAAANTTKIKDTHANNKINPEEIKNIFSKVIQSTHPISKVDKARVQKYGDRAGMFMTAVSAAAAGPIRQLASLVDQVALGTAAAGEAVVAKQVEDLLLTEKANKLRIEIDKNKDLSFANPKFKFKVQSLYQELAAQVYADNLKGDYDGAKAKIEKEAEEYNKIMDEIEKKKITAEQAKLIAARMPTAAAAAPAHRAATATAALAAAAAAAHRAGPAPAAVGDVEAARKQQAVEDFGFGFGGGGYNARMISQNKKIRNRKTYRRRNKRRETRRKRKV